MCVDAVSHEGKVMSPHFFSQSFLVIAAAYTDALDTVVKRCRDFVVCDMPYVGQQDTASLDTAHTIQE